MWLLRPERRCVAKDTLYSLSKRSWQHDVIRFLLCLHKQVKVNDLGVTVTALQPFQKDLLGCVVEPYYNWYRLVDGLNEAGFPVHLANTAAIPKYESIKYTNDDTDARHLAHLFRLGILREGYIYPTKDHRLRD
jgi:transposase